MKNIYLVAAETIDRDTIPLAAYKTKVQAQADIYRRRQLEKLSLLRGLFHHNYIIMMIPFNPAAKELPDMTALVASEDVARHIIDKGSLNHERRRRPDGRYVFTITLANGTELIGVGHTHRAALAAAGRAILSHLWGTL